VRLDEVWRTLAARGVLGMNRRNARVIGSLNPRSAYPVVDNKRLTRQLAERHGIPMPELYGVVETHRGLRDLPAMVANRPSFVMKPARGAAGNGIVLIARHERGQLAKSSGEAIAWSALTYHAACILSGVYSLEGLEDDAVIESLVVVDPVFEAVTFRGVPDLRVIVYKGVPTMAMVRLPTRRSDGRANLHQGAIGAGIALGSGATTTAVQGREVVNRHPDTGERVEGIRVPCWEQILSIAARACDMTGLGYLGADVLIDHLRGPMLLELNARPGLAVQLANRDGLGRRLALIDHVWQPGLPVADRVALGQRLFP
jgi:alpha-L-glutamate ligase-like protein